MKGGGKPWDKDAIKSDESYSGIVSVCYVYPLTLLDIKKTIYHHKELFFTFGHYPKPRSKWVCVAHLHKQPSEAESAHRRRLPLQFIIDISFDHAGLNQRRAILLTIMSSRSGNRYSQYRQKLPKCCQTRKATLALLRPHIPNPRSNRWWVVQFMPDASQHVRLSWKLVQSHPSIARIHPSCQRRTTRWRTPPSQWSGYISSSGTYTGQVHPRIYRRNELILPAHPPGRTSSASTIHN